jgi:hypothetical protein
MLAPDSKITDSLLINLLSSYQSITLAAISLQQSQFFPLNPPPDWMVTLQTNLTEAQSQANDWLVTQGPQVISGIPQTFVTYSNSVQVVADKIQNAQTKQEAIGYLQWLQKRIAAMPATVTNLQGLITQFATNFKPYQSGIETALADAQSAVTQDQEQTKKLSDQISQLYQDIAAETQKADGGMSGVTTSGASLSFALLSYGFAVATTLNPAVPVVGIIVAIGGITYGAIVNAINTAKIVENLKQIKDLQVQLLEENQSIAVLQNISTMLDNVDHALIGINTAVDLTPLWTEETGKLNDLITTLQNYPGDNFKTLPDIASLPQAVTAWKNIAQSATNVLKSATGMALGGVINVDQPQTAAALYN